MAFRRILPLGLIFGLVVLLSCGSSSNLNNQGSPATQNVAITIGDDPISSIASFTVTFESIKLIPSSGDPVTVLSTPTTVELTHLAGTAFPLGSVSIPQGTYTGAQITVSHPTMTMIDASGNPVTKSMPVGPFTANVTFKSPVTIGSTPTTIHFDMNLLGSVTIDASGNVTFTPRVLGSVPMPTFPHVAGTVASVGSNSFTLTTLMGQKTLTFQTDSNTQFFGITGLSQMQKGMLALVDGKLQQDGGFLAARVYAKLMPGSGGFTMGMEGLVLNVKSDGSGFLMVMQGGVGPLLAAAMPGVLANVTVSNGTVFKVDTDNIDLTGFTPQFDISTLKPGQRVEVATNITMTMSSMGMMPSAVITANEVDLVQQGLFGTVSGLNDNTFTLVFPTDSVFAVLTKTTSVTVYKQPGTEVDGTLTEGGKVLVRGLLLNDGGTLKLVASRIVVPTTN